MQTELSADITPREVYNLFVSDEIIEHIVIETNRYAADSLASENLIKKKRKKNRLSKWAETTVDEMKKFLGLLLWMGLVRNGSIEEYWSTLPILSNQVASKTMARNRFQLLRLAYTSTTIIMLRTAVIDFTKLDRSLKNFNPTFKHITYSVILLFYFINSRCE